MTRLERLASDLNAKNLNAFLVSNQFNVRYLSGFSGSSGWLLIGSGEASLITDFRYEEQAQAEVRPGIKVVIEKRDLLAAACDMLSPLAGRIGFEAAGLTFAAYDKLNAACQADLVPTEKAVESLRRVKDEEEIGHIAKASRIMDAAFEALLGELRPGMTEVDVAARLDYLIRREASDVAPFKTIIASGERSSLPHATPTRRVIKTGDFVTMDFGAAWEGYCSDMTRTVVVGRATAEQRKVYDVVREAQAKALEGTRAGITGRDADSIARKWIEEKGYGERFGHGLGHGVGLEVHEEPRLSQKNEEVLERGAVVTVEPGVYIPGWGGVRIEDTVVLEDSGCRVLTRSSKGLLEIGN